MHPVAREIPQEGNGPIELVVGSALVEAAEKGGPAGFERLSRRLARACVRTRPREGRETGPIGVETVTSRAVRAATQRILARRRKGG